jgi:Tfp pilus assembly ATPase PilU
MKTFNLKSKLIIAVTTLGLTLGMASANAADQTTSYEEVVSAYISAQGQQIMAELALNLEKNIASQLQNFRKKHSEIEISQMVAKTIKAKTDTKNKIVLTED